MSVGALLTGGLGTFGSGALVITLGLNSGAVDVITTRLSILGTSQQRLNLLGTSQQRLSLASTSQQRLTLKGSSDG